MNDLMIKENVQDLHEGIQRRLLLQRIDRVMYMLENAYLVHIPS